MMPSDARNDRRDDDHPGGGTISYPNAVDELDVQSAVHGFPAVTGRWQPTRAGVLNSWKWTDEEFHFADGWLAFIGRNGSGKSLTASQLVTVLLDGDTSQTALSVSGRAAGTLMSRHTDNRDKDDKTGVWWLEYGRTDPATAHTEYVTTGLWLRSSSQSLLRAFFLVPGRVGEQLTLQVDRNVAGIDSLAEQLAAHGGEMFTDAQRLKPKAAVHLSAISPEGAYRTAVRSRLFTPLDEVQYDALLSVLRTLRSVRTAEKISARDMLDVLTGALPALDQGRLSEIAAAMQRIATLESQLADTQEQSKKLAGTDQVYELYRRAVALTAAAALRSANTDFDNLTRSQRAAEKVLNNAETEARQARLALGQAKLDLSRREGELGAADTAVRDHAGAELPHHEQRARDLETAAVEAEKRARQAQKDAKTAIDHAGRASQNAGAAQLNLTTITQELAATGGKVQADSALTNLVTAASELTRPGQLDPDIPEVEMSVDEIAATPLAWVDMRRGNVEQVTAALTEMSTANQVAIDAVDQQRAAEDEADQCSTALAESTAARGEIERQLDVAIAGWQQSATCFPPVPEALLEPDPVEGRINPGNMARWLGEQASVIRQQLDVPGHRARQEAAAKAADLAASFATEQQEAASEATGVAATSQVRHDDHVREARLAAEQDAQTDRQATSEHAQSIDAALQYRHDHLLAQLDDTEAALKAVLAWTGNVQRWRSTLRHLDGTALTAPQPLTGQVEQLLTELSAARSRAHAIWLDRSAPVVALAERSLTTLTDYDDGPLRAALAEAAQHAIVRLDRQISEAERVLAESQTRVAKVTADLEEARRTPAPPPAPVWRTRTDGSPLWSLVDFRASVPPDARDRCEGALLVSGLLDAVVTADGRARTGDTVLTGERPVGGPNLADVLTVERGSPIDPALVNALLRSIALVDTTAGAVVRSGVLSAVAPNGYVSRYIGTTARERARAERIAQLEAQLAELASHLEAAEIELSRRQNARTEAVAEQQALPPSTTWQQARMQARAAQLAAQEADREAAEHRTRADTALRDIRETLATNERARDQALAAIRSQLDTARALAEQAERAALTAAQRAVESAESAEEAVARLENAIAEQARADDQRQRFPPLTPLSDAIAEEDEATRTLTTARSRVVGTAGRVHSTQAKARQAFAALNRAVDLGEGRMLPAEPSALKTFAGMLTRLAEQVHSWQRITDRVMQLRAQARAATSAATEQSERAEARTDEATTARATAVGEQAAVAQLRELYGAAYEELRLAREQAEEAYHIAQAEHEQIRGKIHEAEIAAAGATGTLESIAPQREFAERQRESRLHQMSRLVEESVAVVDEGITVDEAGRPANLTAALAWGARMLATQPHGQNRDELARLLENRRTRLETEAKKVSAELARFDRQVTLQTIPGTDWRRAVIAAPDALGGEDLHTTVLTLQQTAQQLEGDLRDDVKVTLKTSMFTALRRDIATRRAAAQELVRQIRSTLGDVRTGVARVGVEVDWKVKRDPDAQRMIELVSALPSDETFEQMYDVLRQRLEDATGDTWEARVAHTFDYRVWHEWDIKVTHASFGAGTTEVFRPLTARSNPLASFSTGEMRLATMLPLLAAAWSMYEAPGYQGPRLLFVDEMNAAFDPQNVRKLLALLREWDFDVLSTAPEMSAMLKAESGHVMIAQVTHSGAVRVSMPWLWTGSGRPVLVASRLGTAATAVTSAGQP
jgi:ABC-type dipeptide/oligopeptide/nickel transport system ATPase component